MTLYILQNAFNFAQSMERYGIITPLRIAHFLGQCATESSGFTNFNEGLNYSLAGLKNAFKKSWVKGAPYVRTATKPADKEKLANAVYGTRNGNYLPGDGYKYRGRGIIQLTGRANYQAYKDASGVDVINNPDLILLPKYAIDSAAWFWSKKGLNKVADSNNVDAVSKIINGGTNGKEDRRLFTKLYLSQGITLEAIKKKQI